MKWPTHSDVLPADAFCFRVIPFAWLEPNVERAVIGFPCDRIAGVDGHLNLCMTDRDLPVGFRDLNLWHLCAPANFGYGGPLSLYPHCASISIRVSQNREFGTTLKFVPGISSGYSFRQPQQRRERAAVGVSDDC